MIPAVGGMHLAVWSGQLGKVVQILAWLVLKRFWIDELRIGRMGGVVIARQAHYKFFSPIVQRPPPEYGVECELIDRLNAPAVLLYFFCHSGITRKLVTAVRARSGFTGLGRVIC